MFNPERLLGGMLRSGMRRGGGLGSLTSGAAALGLVGVAMEAVEHFMNKPKTAGSAPAESSPRMGAAPPPPVMGARPPSNPPPPPSSAVPPPPPGAPGGGTVSEDHGCRADAVLLIRAMIAAANADGMIDARERTRILEKLQAVELSSEDHAFLVQELLAPKDLDSIVKDVTSGQMAEQVYVVSMMAIEVDTEAERGYMNELARRLALTPETIGRLNAQLGIVTG